MKKIAKIIFFSLLPLKALANATAISADRLNMLIEKIYGINSLKDEQLNNPFASSNGLGAGNGIIDQKNQGKIWGYLKDGTLVEIEGLVFEKTEFKAEPEQ